jgi:hypothetical protein
MTRILACSIAFFVLALGVAHAVPARPLYEPAFAVAPPPLIVNLNGSSWLGKYNAVSRVFIFEPDGSLSYSTSTGKGAGKIYKNRGIWRLEGRSLYFENTLKDRKLMEFRGIVIDGNTIIGEATYPLANTKAEQTLKRAPADAGK